MTSRLLLTTLLLLACAAAQGAVERTWFAVYLDGRHIGHMQLRREAAADAVLTATELQLQLLRNGEAMEVRSAESSRETRGGAPLAFSSQFETSGTRSSVVGNVDSAGQARAEVEQGGQKQTVDFAWPRAALLAEGQRLALLRAGLQPGQRSRFLAFDPASLNALEVRSEVLGSETLSADGQPLWRVRQELGRAGASVVTESWLREADAMPRQLRIPALGLQLELRACSRACATAEAVGADVFASTVVASPRALSIAERARPLRFSLRLRQASPQPLAAIPGQFLLPPQADRSELLIDPEGSALLPPTAADRAASRWLQSDDPTVVALAAHAVGRSRHDGRRMARMETAVRRHIARKSLRIGYASAAEVVELREGDCTEHAVLLAAMARAQGIPARVVTGLAYAAGFGDRRDVFVPHAWVIAWVDQRWQGYDAALPRFDAAHIGLTAGSGDPFDFYAGVELLGNLAIESVQPAARRSLRALHVAQRERAARERQP